MGELSKDWKGVDFLSIYKQDFKGEVKKRVKPIIYEDTPDLITLAHQDVLLPEKYKYFKKTYDYEPTSNYYNRLIEEIPSLKEKIDSEPNCQVLEAYLEDSSKTTNQHVYQWQGFEYESLMTSHLRTDLPPDWELPQTTNMKSYRDFGSIIKYDLKTEPIQPPPCNLSPNQELRKILNVKTGVTDYRKNIGALGGDIVREEFHGKILKPSDFMA